MAKIRANIYDKAYVPSLGRGPFMNKVIHEELFRSLKRLGYLVENADEEVSDRLIFDEVDEGFLIDGEGNTTPESPAGGGEGTQQPEPPKDDAGTEQQPSVGDGNENTDQQPSVGDGDSVQTPNTDGPKVDENEAPKEDAAEAPKVETTEAPKADVTETQVETTEAPKADATETQVETTEEPKADATETQVETTEAPKADTVEEPKVDAEDKKAVENKVQLTDDEVKFLTGNARRQEIIDLLTEKGVHIENENATIAELLNLVGLTRN